MTETEINQQQSPEPSPGQELPKKYPIINCHAHIFTGDHVPPYLAKSIIPGPFYRIVNFQRIFKIFRRINTRKAKKVFDGTNNLKARTAFERDRKNRKDLFRRFFMFLISTYLFIWVIDIMMHWFFSIPSRPEWLKNLLTKADYYIHKAYLPLHPIVLQLLVVTGIFIFFKPSRRLILAILQRGSKLFSSIPTKQIKELYDRYLTIGMFAFHEEQRRTLEDLEKQYPDDTGFVILPMDMVYMDAGEPAISYEEQMKELAEIKSKNKDIYPFVFADPRRMKADPDYFSYRVENGDVVLNDSCFLKKYLEDEKIKFAGIKIYPALGYYPFDPLLLPLWKYAQQKNLPIMTHCVRGPMYYRGKKKREWDYHPVFKELIQPLPKGTEPLPEHFTNILLAEKKNDVFSANFTHPMNFLCLLKKEFLAPAVQLAYDEGDQVCKNNLIALFGFTPAANGKDPVVTLGLDDLKICFGHYGGGDEWYRYFEADRYRHSTQVVSRPDFGIDFLYKLNKGQSTTLRSWGKPEQLWKYTDWYSIISSMMLQHKNVYADISYILHADAEILPLLKETLLNKKLRTKVLYGTDFFVVRNHKSDKNMLADMMGGLREEDFDQIARRNPRDFLNLTRYLAGTPFDPL